MKAPIAKAGTTIKPTIAPLGLVEVYHSQDVKQSGNYQSAGCTYGVKIICRDTPKDITAAITRAETIVETALISKLEDHKKLLTQLG